MSISVGFNVLSATLKSSGVHLETSLGVRQFRDDSDCTLRCEVSILDSGKQCKNNFIVFSNFRATIGIVSPTLLIKRVPKDISTPELLRVSFDSVAKLVIALPCHGRDRGFESRRNRNLFIKR